MSGCGDWSDIFQVMTRAQCCVGHGRFAINGNLIAFRHKAPVDHARIELRPVFAPATMPAHGDRFPQFMRNL